jgi:hypothetical protein
LCSVAREALDTAVRIAVGDSKSSKTSAARYGWHVCLRGHEFSADELLAIFAEALERGEEFEWSATMQILTEYASLARRLARLARQRGDLSTAAHELEDRARDAERRMWRLRQARIGPLAY